MQADCLTLSIVRNEGQFGPGRMDWLLVDDRKLVSHCGLRFMLVDILDRLRREAWQRVAA